LIATGEVLTVVAHPSLKVIARPSKKDKSFFMADKYPFQVDWHYDLLEVLGKNDTATDVKDSSLRLIL
jgi:hypothetical protein